jgi:hypothetical protein
MPMSVTVSKHVAQCNPQLELGCRRLYTYFDGESRNIFCACKGPQKSLHADNKVVLEQALWAVRNLAAAGHNDMRKILGDNGVNEAVVLAVSKYVTELGIAEQGCRAILNLAVDGENGVKLGKAGACEIVTKVLELHSSIAERGLRAVHNLAANAYNAV